MLDLLISESVQAGWICQVYRDGVFQLDFILEPYWLGEFVSVFSIRNVYAADVGLVREANRCQTSVSVTLSPLEG